MKEKKIKRWGKNGETDVLHCSRNGDVKMFLKPQEKDHLLLKSNQKVPSQDF